MSDSYWFARWEPAGAAFGLGDAVGSRGHTEIFTAKTHSFSHEKEIGSERECSRSPERIQALKPNRPASLAAFVPELLMASGSLVRPGFVGNDSLMASGTNKKVKSCRKIFPPDLCAERMGLATDSNGTPH